MLQQTRIEAVIPYYERFVSELPDVAALAAVEDERLMKLWEGLGYYSRARNLKRAAQSVMEQYGGELPRTAKELRRLAGIGPYTAGAVASIAFGQPEPDEAFSSGYSVTCSRCGAKEEASP
jgi:A/G-specific adenine glycosylase